jgi:hypothetical protein
MIDKSKLVETKVDPFADLTDQQKNQADLIADIAVIAHRESIKSGIGIDEFEKKAGFPVTDIMWWYNKAEKMTLAQLAKLAANLGIRLAIVKQGERKEQS